MQIIYSPNNITSRVPVIGKCTACGSYAKAFTDELETAGKVDGSEGYLKCTANSCWNSYFHFYLMGSPHGKLFMTNLNILLNQKPLVPK